MSIASEQEKKLKRVNRNEVKRTRKFELKRNNNKQAFILGAKIVIALLFIISFVEVSRIYNATFIDFKTTFLIGFIPGLAATILLVRKWTLYLYGIVCFGYISLWVFFLINALGNSMTFSTRQHIDSRSGFHQRHGGPWVTVYYGGVDKSIQIDTNDEALFNKSAHLILTLRKGLFGFYIIENQQLD